MLSKCLKYKLKLSRDCLNDCGSFAKLVNHYNLIRHTDLAKKWKKVVMIESEIVGTVSFRSALTVVNRSGRRVTVIHGGSSTGGRSWKARVIGLAPLYISHTDQILTDFLVHLDAGRTPGSAGLIKPSGDLSAHGPILSISPGTAWLKGGDHCTKHSWKI